MYSFPFLFTRTAHFAFSNVTKIEYGSHELGTVCILCTLNVIMTLNLF